MSHSVTTVNPYTLKNIKTYQVQSKEDVMKALDKSDKAFQNWKLVEIEEKTELLYKVAEILEAKKHDFALLMTQEMGKPISESIAEIEKCMSSS